jgi:hypothetical protein
VRRRAAGLLVLATLALVGCGGSSTTDEPPARTTKPSSNQNPEANLGAP